METKKISLRQQLRKEMKEYEKLLGMLNKEQIKQLRIYNKEDIKTNKIIRGLMS